MSGRSPVVWAIIASSFFVCLVVALAAHSRMTLNPEFRVFVQMIKLNKEIYTKEKFFAQEGKHICDRGVTAARKEIPQFARRLIRTYEKFDASLNALNPATTQLQVRRQMLRKYIALKKAAVVLLAQAMESYDEVLLEQSMQKISEAKKVAEELRKPELWYGVRPTYLTK